MAGLAAWFGFGLGSVPAGALLGVGETYPPGTFFAIDSQNNLRRGHVSAPGQPFASVTITGTTDAIVGIDFRPANGHLYGLGSSSKIYRIDTTTGRATPIGDGFSPALSGSSFGFDFNPKTDLIRVVSDAEQNLRIDPDTGEVVSADSSIHPAGNVAAIAYGSNFAGAPSSTLYAIDSSTDQLLIQSPKDGGLVSPVGPLGVDTSPRVGFEIAAPGGIAYASLTNGVDQSSLYTVNLATGAVSLVGAIAGAFPVVDITVATGPEQVVALTGTNRLLELLAHEPGTIRSSTAVSGLQPGENLLAIDFRPATGELYGIGSTSRLYRIDTPTGAATQIGAAGSWTLNGTDFGMDFNPTVDRLRIVSNAEQNLRVHPDTGALAFSDAPLNPAGNVVACAYTNNFAGATSTALYDLDSGSDLLLVQNPPNNGVLSAVGPLGVDFGPSSGLDIARSGVVLASLTAPAAGTSQLYRVDLGTGAATLFGTIGGGEVIRDISARLTTELLHAATFGASIQLIRFNAATPGVIQSSVTVTGLQPAEYFLGIDSRPSNRRLYAIGSTSRLYTIDVQTGVATAVGAPFSPALSGSSFGMDFNPITDLIRVVSSAEQNLRLNPDTGQVFSADAALNPAGNVVAAAYTSNFPGSPATTLFDVDSATDQLKVQSPPNDGTVTLVGSLGVDLGSNVGFDIAARSGNAYLYGYPPAATSPSLYLVNLATGQISLVGTINSADPLLGMSATDFSPLIFADDFETGNALLWSSTVP